MVVAPVSGWAPPDGAMAADPPSFAAAWERFQSFGRDTPLSWSKVPLGDPLLVADPRIWMPVLHGTGDLAQAIEAALGPDAPTPEYSLYPLGDANGDGRTDFLLETSIPDPNPGFGSKVTLQAISGLDHATLWSHQVPARQYWFTVPDVDGDGVADLVLGATHMYRNTTSQSQNGVSLTRSLSNSVRYYEILSGATGTSLFSTSCSAESTLTQVRASAPSGAGSGSYRDDRFGFCGLLVAGGVLKLSGVDSRLGPGGFVAGAFTQANVVSETMTLERLSGSGKSEWRQTIAREQEYVNVALIEDYSGDGVADFLVRSRPAAVGFACVPIDCFVPPSALPDRLTMVDGRTGALSWTIEVGRPNSLAALSDVGFIEPGKRGILVTVSSADASAGNRIRTTLDVVSGATGSKTQPTQELVDELAVGIGAGDANRDGKGELFVARGVVSSDAFGNFEFPTKVKVGVADLSFSWLWEPLEIDLDQAYPFPDRDYDGDRALEITVFEEADGAQFSATVVSGATGKKLWSHLVDASTVTAGGIDDLTGDGGAEFALVRFDLPPATTAPALAGGGPAQVPGGTRPTEAPDTRNYGRYPGFLEIRRGADKELVWEKKIHDPTTRLNHTAEHLDASLFVVPDTNANGHADLLFNLDVPILAALILGPGGQVSFEEGERPTNPLALALVIDGGDGTTLRAYPTAAGKEPPTIGRAAPVQPKDVDVGGGSIPSPPFLLLVAVIVLGAAWRRRQA